MSHEDRVEGSMYVKHHLSKSSSSSSESLPLGHAYFTLEQNFTGRGNVIEGMFPLYNFQHPLLIHINEHESTVLTLHADDLMVVTQALEDSRVLWQSPMASLLT
jgi:hypothetical protein